MLQYHILYEPLDGSTSYSWTAADRTAIAQIVDQLDLRSGDKARLIACRVPDCDDYKPHIYWHYPTLAGPPANTETCPLCGAPALDGRLTCECDDGCSRCSETPGARAGGASPHFGCMCECHHPFARAMAEREAGGPLCWECGSRLYSGVCQNEGGCSRYCSIDDEF